MSKNLSVPQEIIVDILTRLPVKSLLRFKCVSKRWFSLISNPEFARLHLKQVNQKNTAKHRVFLSSFQSLDPEAFCGIGGDDVSAIQQHHIPTNLLFDDFNFVGSCNGLISVVDPDSNHFAVFNPTTRQVRDLPISDSKCEGKTFYGFGYDSQIDDYKIVRGTISSSIDNGIHEVKIEIFNLKDNSWRTIKGRHCRVAFEGEGVFLNGVLHWLKRNNIGGVNDFIHEIIKFDLIEERFLDPMPLPSQIDHVNLNEDLVVVDECLWVYTHCYATYFGAWKMMDSGVQDSWTRVYQFNNDNFPGCKYHLQFLYLTKAGQLLFDKDGYYLMRYNPKHEKIEKLSDDEDWDWIQPIMYVESLVSTNIEDYADQACAANK